MVKYGQGYCYRFMDIFVNIYPNGLWKLFELVLLEVSDEALIVSIW